TFLNSFVFGLALLLCFSSTQTHCSHVTSSVPVFGTPLRHAFTLQVSRSRVWINRARARVSGQFQGQRRVHTEVIHSRNQTLAQFKSFYRFGVCSHGFRR
ncbi:hypothetical protein AMECASPLE_001362, partial [Ameca splendens]